jgi:Putative beta-barrel porin-2, OmpL-like. bbp2
MSRLRDAKPVRALFPVAIAALMAVAAPAQAQQPAPSPVASPSPAPSPTPPPPPSIDVVGFVDVYYGYNFNKVDPLLRTFDVQHNTFSLSLAELNFTKTPTAESKVGFRADLDFGKTADIVASFEPASDGKEIYKNIQQAYVSLLTGKVQWDAGKFVTPVGAEVIESQDNWNYTRSILFGYAIPFYHCGVRATATPNDKVAIAGYITNGWNNCSEVNGDKTFALGVTLKPSSKVTVVGNLMAGKEAPTPADTRVLFDTTVTLAPSSKFSVMGNFDYGKEGDTKWWGLAAYAKLSPSAKWSLVGRFEYLDDSKGGFMTIKEKAQTFTLTSDHLIAGGLRTRIEYRLDHAKGFFVDHDGNTKDNQSTVTVGVVYLFGTKI